LKGKNYSLGKQKEVKYAMIHIRSPDKLNGSLIPPHLDPASLLIRWVFKSLI